MFGKRNRPVQPEQKRQTSGGGGPGDGDGSGTPSAVAPKFPWDNDPSLIACNLAAGNLANSLPSWVEHEKRVHAETYVAASGAIAGYAAQQTLRVQEPEAALHVVTTAAGEKYLFGDALNNVLLAKTESEADGRVWPRAAGAAVSAGLPAQHVPNLDDMFRHVAKSLGSPLEGLPSTSPDHRPVVPVRQLLASIWPHVAALFSADFDDLHRRFGPVPPRWWGAVAAYATARPIIDVANVLHPSIALTILMESAIYASKLTKL